MCSADNNPKRIIQSCSVKHENQSVECVGGVVYSVPLSCGKTYVGQTGRCLNKRLKEHNYNVRKAISGHLGIHCRDCSGCTVFHRTQVIAKHKDRITREIIEAAEIDRRKENCVSVPSVSGGSRGVAVGAIAPPKPVSTPPSPLPSVPLATSLVRLPWHHCPNSRGSRIMVARP